MDLFYLYFLRDSNYVVLNLIFRLLITDYLIVLGKCHVIVTFG